ncbi:uncharacterized protein LOC141593151 [Silene latifolia]|uniref:uncharacterized protein LOC141593151 n=1 Tax=Silene latifolia TaxID=37657 RepID=UPI003D76CDFB
MANLTSNATPAIKFQAMDKDPFIAVNAAPSDPKRKRVSQSEPYHTKEAPPPSRIGGEHSHCQVVPANTGSTFGGQDCLLQTRVLELEGKTYATTSTSETVASDASIPKHQKPQNCTDQPGSGGVKRKRVSIRQAIFLENSSIGGTFNVQTLKGIYVFKLQGQMYHYVPNLLPTVGGPRYLQLYFYDRQHEAEWRAGCLPELRRDVVDIIMEFNNMNPYARFFQSLQEIDVQEDTRIVINKNARTDQRVYNAPTSDEVAVIWSEQSASDEMSGPHITVTGKSDKSHRILHYYACYDPLQYPLLFPFEESGWHQGLKKFESGSTLATIKSMITASTYIDAEQLLEDESHHKRELGEGEEAQKHPDIVARFYRAKLVVLKKLIMEKQICGEVATFIYIVEFQKGGLLHAHFLIILKTPYKINSLADFDKYVSAEIPAVESATLRASVLKHIMQGPCGNMNPECALKYLYKYVYKDHDKISFNVTATDGPKVLDEIEHFQSGRWVSPCEAMWRIYGFDLYEIQPPVMPLQIHLPNMQSIQMRQHENLETVISNEKKSRIALTELF